MTALWLEGIRGVLPGRQAVAASSQRQWGSLQTQAWQRSRLLRHEIGKGLVPLPEITIAAPISLSFTMLLDLRLPCPGVIISW